jgi:hypothetical protein
MFTKREQELITQNLIFASAAVAKAVDLAQHHLHEAEEACPFWCLGMVGEQIEDMPPPLARMMLSVSIRVMAEQLNGTLNLVQWTTENAAFGDSDD